MVGAERQLRRSRRRYLKERTREAKAAIPDSASASEQLGLSVWQPAEGPSTSWERSELGGTSWQQSLRRKSRVLALHDLRPMRIYTVPALLEATCGAHSPSDRTSAKKHW